MASEKTSEKLSIPTADDHRRRSMELEERPLPEGWVRQYDPTSDHHFYVDTRANPPRSIWNHPLDDETYIDSHDRHPSDSDSSDDDEAGPPAHEKEKSRNVNPNPAPNQGQPSSSAQRGGNSGGFWSNIMNAFSGPSHEDPALQQRYNDRRAILNQGQGRVPINMAGPMYDQQGAALYAPPPMPFMGRHSYHDYRRYEKGLRRQERRNARAVRRAIRRGYPVSPVLMAPAPAPLFGYRSW